MTTPDHGGDATAQMHGGHVLIMRLRFLCAMAVSATVFWYVGWQTAKPVDPAGPVSLHMLDHPTITLLEMLGLAIVGSGLAVAICGAGSAERGPLAIAIGLATLAGRGTQLDRLLLYRMNAPGAEPGIVDPFPVFGLVAECWLWLALIAVGFVVGRWVEGWFDDGSARTAHRSEPTRSGPTHADHSSDIRHGIGTTGVAALVAWTVLSFTIGSDVEPLEKGQIYFSVGLSFLVGALAARWFWRDTSRIWALAAVAAVAAVAYGVGQPEETAFAAAREAGAYVNLRPLARPLPIEFAALGATGVLIESDAMRFVRAILGLSPADQTEKPNDPSP